MDGIIVQVIVEETLSEGVAPSAIMLSILQLVQIQQKLQKTNTYVSTKQRQNFVTLAYHVNVSLFFTLYLNSYYWEPGKI